MLNKISDIKDEWIKVALANTSDDKSLRRYLRDGGLNTLQINYIFDIRNKDSK